MNNRLYLNITAKMKGELGENGSGNNVKTLNLSKRVMRRYASSKRLRDLASNS